MTKNAKSARVQAITPPHVVSGMAAFDKLLKTIKVEAAATEKADDPQDAADVAFFLREAANDYEANNCGKGNIALARAFEFAAQLFQKGELKLRPDSKARTKKAAKIEMTMAALKDCHLMTVMEVARHYHAHPYVDKFEDEVASGQTP